MFRKVHYNRCHMHGAVIFATKLRLDNPPQAAFTLRLRWLHIALRLLHKSAYWSLSFHMLLAEDGISIQPPRLVRPAFNVLKRYVLRLALHAVRLLLLSYYTSRPSQR